MSLTNDGWQVQQAIKKEINELEVTLPELVANAPEKAQNILRQIKGNVFLLTNIDLAALSIAEKDLLAQLDRKEQDTAGDGYVSSCSGCSTWDNYSEYSGSWDSSCSSDSGSSGGDSGGDSSGGDSGCSGCGGCGGGD